MESAMLNQKRNSVGILKTVTFMRITETSTNASIQIDTSTQTRERIDLITSFITVGSGAIVKHEKNVSFILTAAHVCNIVYPKQISNVFPFYDPETYEIMFSRINMFHDIEGKSHIALPLVWNSKYDVCMMVTERIEQSSIRLARRTPTHGQKIYYMGFPRGIGGDQFIPIFDGYYIGTKTINDWTKRAPVAGYSVPIAPGSSGSSVLDGRGNIIGMLHSYYVRFDNLGLSATHEQLKELFDKADKFWAKKKDEFVKELNPSL